MSCTMIGPFAAAAGVARHKLAKTPATDALIEAIQILPFAPVITGPTGFREVSLRFEARPRWLGINFLVMQGQGEKCHADGADSRSLGDCGRAGICRHLRF